MNVVMETGVDKNTTVARPMAPPQLERRDLDTGAHQCADACGRHQRGIHVSEQFPLVVGARGHGSFIDLVLGSVSSHCVHHAPCTVVVRPNMENKGNGE